MAEDNEYLVVEETAAVAADDLNQTVQYNEGERLSDRQAVLCPETNSVDMTAYIIGAQQSISLANPGGPTVRFSASATGARKPKTGVMERGGIAAESVPTTEVATWTASTDGFSAIPFDCAGTAIYQIALRNNDIPSDPRLKLNGDKTWLRWEHAIGERTQPSAVAEQAVPGSGLRLTMTAVIPELATWTDAARTRPCRVWYHPTGTAAGDPPNVTSSEAFYDGVLETDGAAVWIDVPHYFGEAAPGVLTANLYHVHVHGFSIADRAAKDYTTILALGVRTYIVLAEFDFAAGTLDYSEQLNVLSLPNLSTGTAAAVQTAVAFRAGANIGDLTATALWNDGIVGAVGATYVTFTYANPITGGSDQYLCSGVLVGPTAPELPGVSSTFRSGGLVASMLVSVGAGTYAVVALRDNSNTLYLDTYTPALTAAFERTYLVVATFDWNGAAVTAYYPRDLNARRGVGWGALLGSGQEANGEHLTVRDIALTQVGDDTQVDLYGLDGQSPRQDNLFGRLRYNTVGWPAQYIELQLNPDQQVAGNLGAGEYVRFILGNLSSDYSFTAVGDAVVANKYFQLADDAGAVFEHRRLLGESDGTTGRVIVEDVHLNTTKTRPFTASLSGAHGHTQPHATGTSQTARVLWQVLDLGSFDVDGNNAANQTLFSTQIVDRYGSAVGDCYTLKVGWEFTAVVGNALDYFRIYLVDNGGATLIWDSAAAPFGGPYTPGANDLGYLELAMHVNNNGAVGPMDVTPRVETHNAVGPAPFGAAPVNEAQFQGLASHAIDFVAVGGVSLRMDVKWAVANAGQVLAVTHVDLTRQREDLWHYNGKDGWNLPRGNGRELRVDLPFEVTHGRELVDVEVYAGVTAGAAGTCKIVLDLIEYDPPTGVETSLLAATVDVAVAGPGPFTLTCNPANHALAWDKRYYVLITTVQTTAGGDFYVNSVQGNYRTDQL